MQTSTDLIQEIHFEALEHLRECHNLAILKDFLAGKAKPAEKKPNRVRRELRKGLNVIARAIVRIGRR